MKPPADERVDVLLACSEGGHLLELVCLEPAWRSFSRAWVSPDTEDVRWLLRDENVYFPHLPRGRNPWDVLRNVIFAWRVLRRLRPHVILATGSSVAVPYAWLGRLLRARVVYVECGGRVDGVSLSCRLIAPVAHVTYVQWPQQETAVRGARYVGRVPLPPALTNGATGASGRESLIFATVGSGAYPFDRLVEAVGRLAGPERIVVQRGASELRPGNATSFEFMAFERVVEHIARARVVIAHAGVGSVLLVLAHGKRPIVMARRRELGENVDDHQVAFARALDAAGLAQAVDDAQGLARAIAETPLSVQPQERDGRLAEELREYIARYAPRPHVRTANAVDEAQLVAAPEAER